MGGYLGGYNDGYMVLNIVGEGWKVKYQVNKGGY